MKPVVHYIGTPANVCVGKRAILWPTDHPDSELVSNTQPVVTSPIIHVNRESGLIETQNTMYIPKDTQEVDVWQQSGAR